jgi:DDE superfamily endonuclease
VHAWRAKNPRITLHFTPTSGSWLNIVEIFFGVITRQAIRRGTFTSVKDLIAAIETFIDAWKRALRTFHLDQDRRRDHPARDQSSSDFNSATFGEIETRRCRVAEGMEMRDGVSTNDQAYTAAKRASGAQPEVGVLGSRCSRRAIYVPVSWSGSFAPRLARRSVPQVSVALWVHPLTVARALTRAWPRGLPATAFAGE